MFGAEEPALPVAPPAAPEAPERKPSPAPAPKLPRPGLAGGTAEMRADPPARPREALAAQHTVKGSDPSSVLNP